MSINDFINLLKEHNVDFNKDLAVVPDEDEDGYDFNIEESEFAVYLVNAKTLWGHNIHHSFFDEQ